MVNQAQTRREEILRVSHGLFLQRGYDRVSVNEIISAVGIAKGTFYHHFSSKDALLEELIEHRAEEIFAVIEGIASDTSRSALERLTGYFRTSVFLKAEDPGLLVAALHTFYRPENTLLRVRMMEANNARIAPVLGRLVQEGVDSGEFRVPDPQLCGQFLIRGFATLSDGISRKILEDPQSPTLNQELHRVFDFMEWTTARLLGVPLDAVSLADRAAVDRLFGAEEKEHL
jgi:AcrR family transcriptional regulator